VNAEPANAASSRTDENPPEPRVDDRIADMRATPAGSIAGTTNEKLARLATRGPVSKLIFHPVIHLFLP
jgi:hypothetical protein